MARSRKSSSSNERSDVAVFAYEYESKKTGDLFWKGKLSIEDLEQLLDDFPNGCDVYINENPNAGKELKSGKGTQCDFIIE